MNIMDMFKTAKPAQEGQQQQGQPKQEEQKTGTSVAKPASNASEQNANNPAKDQENPFDKYQQMFENAAKNSDIQAPSFNIAPEVLADVSSKMDFTKGINPELVQKASSGDAAAMMEMMKQVGQNAYRASLEHSTKLTDVHLGQRSEFESKRLQKGVKEQLTRDAFSSNANINHPVIKAELNRIAANFAASPEYADASPQEIAKAAQQYLNDLHAAMNPADPSKDKEGKAKPKEIDYMAYLGGT